MKTPGKRGRRKKYQPGQKATIRISLFKSEKSEIIRLQKLAHCATLTDYIMTAIKHFQECETARLASMHGKEVQLRNGSIITVIKPDKDFHPSSLFDSALGIITSSIEAGRIKNFKWRTKDGRMRVNPVLIKQYKKACEDPKLTTPSLKADRYKRNVTRCFYVMLFEYESLKTVPEYKEWLGRAYGYAGNLIDDYDEIELFA